MDTAVVECRYRDKVIGHLVVGADGWLKYARQVKFEQVKFEKAIVFNYALTQSEIEDIQRQWQQSQ